MKRTILFSIVAIIALPQIAFSSENDRFIRSKGKASTVTQPTIAHCFLKITGTAKNYELSGQVAKDKLKKLESLLNESLELSTPIQILNTENKLKGQSFDDLYSKQFITGMAKAIKGEEITHTDQEKPKEMSTVISVYFSFEKFTQESIVMLKSKLIDKEIAFDKQSLYDFPLEFDSSKSAIVFGLSNYDKLFSELAAEAYKNAKNDAKVIVSATGNTLGELLRVSGCSDKLEGSINLSDDLNLTGKNLGPLSLDPQRLLVNFSTTFEFAILK